MSIEPQQTSNSSEGTLHQVRSLLVDAYQVGKLLRRVQYVGEQAWLGFAGYREQVIRAFNDLRLAVRRLVAPEQRDSLQRIVDQGWDTWQTMYESEWRDGLLSRSNEELVFCMDDSGELVTRIRESLLGCVIGLVGEIRRHVETHLDAHGCMAMSLGACVERGMANAEFLRELSVPEIPPTPTDPVVLQSLPALGDSQISGPEISPNYLRNCRWATIDLRPIDAWIAELRHRWTELGLCDNLPPFDANESGPAAILDFTSLCDEAFASAVAISGNDCEEGPPPPPKPGYLGLVVNTESYCVGREGSSSEVVLKSTRKRSILQLLIRNRATFTPRRAIAALWESRRGMVESRKDGTINNEISDLRGLLRPLQVEIKNERSIGWRLQDARAGDSSSSEPAQ